MIQESESIHLYKYDIIGRFQIDNPRRYINIFSSLGPPNVSPLRALGSLVGDIQGSLEISWAVMDVQGSLFQNYKISIITLSMQAIVPELILKPFGTVKMAGLDVLWNILDSFSCSSASQFAQKSEPFLAWQFRITGALLLLMIQILRDPIYTTLPEFLGSCFILVYKVMQDFCHQQWEPHGRSLEITPPVTTCLLALCRPNMMV